MLDPLGFLAITGLHWLDVEPQRFDDVPGEWSHDDTGVRVALNDDEELVVDGERVRRRPRPSVTSTNAANARTLVRLVVEVARRDGHFMIRPRHPDHVIRTRYDGTPTYAPSTDWVARGTFIPYDPPRSDHRRRER